MRAPVYNSAIPQLILNTVNRATRLALLGIFPLFFLLIAVVLGLVMAASATDWSGPEEQLARKIAAATGPGAVAVTVGNRSSLGRRDQEVIQNGLLSALERLGVRFVPAEQAAATVIISLSENAASYVWVAQIHQGTGEGAVVMVSAARPEGSVAARDSMPLTLNRILLWSQEDPILDVAVLQESPAPTHIAVLDPDKISLYRMQSGKWQQEQVLPIVHARPWPRDPRGRLISSRDHLFDVFLPGVICRSAATLPLTLNCHESDDPWPLTGGMQNGVASSAFPGGGSSSVPAGADASGASRPPMKGFFAPTRNFFTGALTPAIGKFTTAPKFYSAAPLPRDKYTLWLFASTDDQVHLIDGVSDQTAKLGWGSDLTSVKTSCGAGWQVLATAPANDVGDFVRAYEFPDRDPVAVSAALEFAGPVTALWTESRSDSAVVVSRSLETGSYEAFRLALSCSQ